MRAGERGTDDVKDLMRRAAIADVALLATSDLPLDELLARALETVVPAFEADHGRIVRLHDDGSTLRVLAECPGPSEQRTSEAAEIIRRTLDSGQPVVVQDPEPGDLSFSLVQIGGIRSVAAVPIRGPDGPLAVLKVVSSQPARFPDPAVEDLAAVARVLGGTVGRPAT